MLKTLKEELLFIPIMFIVMEIFRYFLATNFPETALFDKGSELESFLLSVWQVAWVSCAALLLLRIVFPPAYRKFKEFYATFDKQDDTAKESYSVIFYLVFFFGLIWLVNGKAATPSEPFLRKKLIDTLYTQLNVREATGHNDGVEVEKYLTYVGRYKGDSWCAAFTSWNLNAVGVTTPPNPKSGWSPNFATPKYTVWSHALVKQHKAKPPKPGDCFTLYYSNLGRVGHVGFIVDETESYFITIEGNTGLTGSRDGSGVHKYKRAKSKVYAVTNYITPFTNQNEKITHSNIGPNIFGGMPQRTYEVFGENNRNYNDTSNSKGQYSCKRYNRESKGRQLSDTSNSYCRRYYGPSEFTGNESNIRAIRRECIHNEWKANGKMCLQRFRVNCSISATDNRTFDKGSQGEGERAYCRDYCPGAVHPEVG